MKSNEKKKVILKKLLMKNLSLIVTVVDLSLFLFFNVFLSLVRSQRFVFWSVVQILRLRRC